jgi:hypothetical protein
MKQDDAVSGQGQDLGARALEIAQRRQKAARDVIEMLEGEFGPTPESPETVLYAAAWLAGTSLYRSIGIEGKIEPGTPVLSDEANRRGPELLAVFSKLLGQFGITITQEDLTFNVPSEHQSKMGILEVQRKMQTHYNEIMKQNLFDFREGAKTGAVVCAMLVKSMCQDRKLLPLGLAAGIVSMGFVEGSKTAPMPMR